jgi:dTDP-4-dehydrorhamnose 3,5-epimerase
VKLLSAQHLAIPDIHVVRFARFADKRGYFTETYRRSDFENGGLTPFLKGAQFVQANESFSRAGTVRGLHFQWNPFMGKLVRTIHGRMIDLILDIRKGSPTLGKIIAYDLPALETADYNEWIWVPPGFAHGNLFPVDTVIEYFCTGEYSVGCEAGISPLALDLDWSICEPALRGMFQDLAPRTELMTEKDKNGFTLAAWLKDERSNNFVYGQ